MIELTREDGVWLVRLNRPEKANSLTAAMLRELAEIAEAAGSEARGVIVTGAGEKVFSAGADLDAVKAGLATDPVWERLSRAIAALPVPSVAALNGTLAGGAFGMALACDMRLAVPGARFFYPVAKLGVLPQPSDPARLSKLIGPARAKMILVAGQKIEADEALAWGLVDRVVPRDELMERARALLEPALTGERDHVAAIKAMLAG